MVDPKANLEHYPNLEALFNSLDPSIKGGLTFEAIQEQLMWAFNDYEQKRAIHRLYWVIKSFSEGNNPYFQKLSAAQKQALIALTILDGCKNSNDSIRHYSSQGLTALKDGVPSLFDMVAKAPAIFPIYNKLSEQAKQVIKDEFFYLHLRHLQLGEVPVASIPKTTLARKRDLMVAFWYANSMGFAIDRPNYPLGEGTGPTISEDQKQQFTMLVVSMDNNDLTDYYAKDSIFVGRTNLKNSFSKQAVEFICRLGKMLSFVGLKENDENYLQFVGAHQSEIEDLVSLETAIFSDHSIEAFTFLPAVLKALKENIMSDKTVGKVLEVFIDLQKQLYLSVPGLINNIGNNRTIPLFDLSKTQDDMLKKFANSDNRSEFHFVASMQNFINVNLVDGPVPEVSVKSQAHARVN